SGASAQGTLERQTKARCRVSSKHSALCLDQMQEITYRDLTSLSDFATVVDLEQAIWGPGYTEPVPVPILAGTVKRGGILIGAFDGLRMIGFVCSLAGLTGGRAMQWSHVAGGGEQVRNAGLG